MKFAFPLSRCSKHRHERLIDGSNIFPFFGSNLAFGLHEHWL
jgi:hypothetical protein